MNRLRNIATTVALLMFSIFAKAQETSTENNVLKSDGKIYVVMIVVIVIVAGLFLYLINLDRKISKIEKK